MWAVCIENVADLGHQSAGPVGHEAVAPSRTRHLSKLYQTGWQDTLSNDR
jgi:hypothetical protein